MTEFSIGIRRWAAWASAFSVKDGRLEEAGSAETLLESSMGKLLIGDAVPVPKTVNAMLRRRLAPLGKAAVWAAEQVLDAKPHTGPCVFASQHGEVRRTVEILKNHFSGLDVSPTAFSLSVHNAIAGVFSIAHKIENNISALAAGEQTLAMALLESAALLDKQTCRQEDKNNEPVLCVYYDQPIPAYLSEGSIAPKFSFSIALLLEKNIEQSASHIIKMGKVKTNLHPFESLVQHLLNKTPVNKDKVAIGSWYLEACA